MENFSFQLIIPSQNDYLPPPLGPMQIYQNLPTQSTYHQLIYGFINELNNYHGAYLAIYSYRLQNIVSMLLLRFVPEACQILMSAHAVVSRSQTTFFLLHWGGPM